jgi:hypothetical protein
VSAFLVAAGAAFLWPVLAARHGRGVALSTLAAVVFGTVAFGLALESWPGAAAFALAAGLVRIAWGREETSDARRPRARRVAWIASATVAALVLAARGGGPGDVLDGLFSSWSGLLFWSPILWLAVYGCVRERGSGTSEALLPVLVVAAAVGAVTPDDGPYPGMLFAPVLPLLAVGLGRALAAIRDSARRHPLRAVAAGIAVLAAGNALLMGQYRDGRIPRDDTVAFPRVARNAAATVSGAVGSPNAWPANWIFAARHDVSPARYDLLGGVSLFGRVTPGGAPRGGRGEAVLDVGHLPTDEAVLRGGWSVRHPCGAGVCRAVEGRAGVLAPIRDPLAADLSVAAEGAGTLRVEVNGVAVLETPLAGAEVHTVRLPAARFRRGLNSIALTVSPGGRALVDRITFTPVEP